MVISSICQRAIEPNVKLLSNQMDIIMILYELLPYLPIAGSNEHKHVKSHTIDENSVLQYDNVSHSNLNKRFSYAVLAIKIDITTKP